MSATKDVAIKVDNVRKTFKLPHERQSSIKSAIINFYRRKRTFELQTVLKDVSFDINQGEFFGIVGRNGSGKSTLLKLIAGIYTPSRGAITINGKLTPFIELGVGFNPELTGRENVFLNGALLGFNRKEMEALYDEIVEFAELEKFMDQKLKNYSSGMQVRLAFSIAIRAKSDILLLDEVLAVGDAAFQQKCYDYFEEIKRQKQTVVFVTHDMAAVKRFCTKAILIEQGKIKKTGTSQDVADQYLVDNIAPIKKQKIENAKQVNKLVKSLKGNLSSNEFNQHDVLKLNVNYAVNEAVDLMLGIAVIQHGVSVAEINSKATKLDSKPNVMHSAELDIDLSTFNPGVYTINVSVMRRENGEILDYKLAVGQFIIKGNDQTRGAAVYIKGGWKQA